MIRHLITHILAPRLIALADRRPADVPIGGEDNPYLLRWFLIPRNRWFNLYLHNIRRSDDDRALHDYPWWNISVILRGYYVEHTIASGGVNVRTLRTAGDIKLRGAKAAHRLELISVYDHARMLCGQVREPQGFSAFAPEPCWTLFITGPRLRTWGFHCPQGWRDWRVFTNPLDGGRTTGRGCGEDDGAAGGSA